ncbi:MAG: zf-HC2 domain-containing protein [Acidobacteria bacterium]|nr:zf-HC2 domain-containing protein [Acidobacteriota bacterium]
MDHRQAEREYAVERYLLGQMPEAEQDQFEEHFFSCGLCAEEIRTGSAFVANMKAVFDEMAPVPLHPRVERPRWWEPLFARWNPAAAALAACGVLAAVVGYQNLYQLPALRARAGVEQTAVSAIPTFKVAMERGGGEAFTVSRRSQRVRFDVTHDWDENFPSYLIEVQRQGGAVTDRFSLPGTKGNVEVRLNVSGMAAGRYTIVISGVKEGQSAKAPLGRIPVEITE